MSQSHTSAPNSTYLKALKRCSEVAHEEHQVANAALADAEKLIGSLQKKVSQQRKSSKIDGAAIANVDDFLTQLESDLTHIQKRTIARTGRSLERTRDALDRFTVTLFGRTMAGKSTIREALTYGDGETIGKGAQRTTRDIREYTWNALRIIDTPGIGAYQGQEDKELAMSVMDETDVVLFLLSSDGVQAEVFEGMRALRQLNKPMMFVLNMKRDLERPVNLRRFLKDPTTIFNEADLAGHFSRVQHLAETLLNMNDVKIVPIHAQAAFLATRPEHAEHAEALREQSRIEDLLNALENEVSKKGVVRRVQTIVDGTQVSLLQLEKELRKQSEQLTEQAEIFGEKVEELESWSLQFKSDVWKRIESEATAKLRPLRNSIGSFLDRNIEKTDISERWARRYEKLELDKWGAALQEEISEDLRTKLFEFTSAMSVESTSLQASAPGRVQYYDDVNWKKNFDRVGAAGGVLFGAALVFPPVAWVAGALAIGGIIGSLFSDSKEEKLNEAKQKAAISLRENLDAMRKNMVGSLNSWFDSRIVNNVINPTLVESRSFVDNLQKLSDLLIKHANKIGALVDSLNRRLYVRSAAFIDSSIDENVIVRVARTPGRRAKVLWDNAELDEIFCTSMTSILGEETDWVVDGYKEERIAQALQPAVIDAAQVQVKSGVGIVRLSPHMISVAMGPEGDNLALAQRLLKHKIELREERGSAND